MDWKIRNIRLQELREIYQEKLKNIAYRVYESHFQNGIVKQEELEGEIINIHNLLYKSFIHTTLHSGNIFTRDMSLQTVHFYAFLKIRLTLYK